MSICEWLVLIRKLGIKEIWAPGHSLNLGQSIWVYNINIKSTHFSLHSKFMLLCCDIIWTIRNLVASSTVDDGVDVAAGADAIDGAGATGADWAFVLNAPFIWAIVGLFMCSISFLMQKPLPDGTMTSMRWNEQMFSDGLERSRYSPVTVSSINLGWKIRRHN